MKYASVSGPEGQDLTETPHPYILHKISIINGIGIILFQVYNGFITDFSDFTGFQKKLTMNLGVLRQ
jgi:hypothetical protein